MTTDLITWLRAQLDDVEQDALACEFQTWLLDDTSIRHHGGYDVVVVRDDIRGNAEAHIARHDPARVLAEVEVKRQILDEYDAAVAARREHPDDLANAGRLLTMVRIVKLLALPYASRPGAEGGPPNG